MASVQILPGLTVAIASVDSQGRLAPMRSSPTGLGTPNVTHHSLEVVNGTEFGVLLKFNMSTLRSFHHVDYVEVVLFFDGRAVAHHQIPIADIITLAGECALTTFTDRRSGTVKTAEFRALTTSMMHQTPFSTSMATDR